MHDSPITGEMSAGINENMAKEIRRVTMLLVERDKTLVARDAEIEQLKGAEAGLKKKLEIMDHQFGEYPQLSHMKLAGGFGLISIIL